MKNIFEFLFGRFNYQMPLWLQHFISFFSKTKIGKRLSEIFKLRATNPKKFYRMVAINSAIAIVFSASSFIGYKWWQGRPRPKHATFRVEIPRVADPETQEADYLSIRFSQSVARLEDLNTTIVDKIKLKPNLSGTWFWASDRILRFKPDFKTKADWQVGTKYEFEFKNKLFADHIRVEKTNGHFTTLALTARSQQQEFVIDQKDPRIKKGIVTFYFTHPIQVDDFKSRLTASIFPESGLGVSQKVNYNVQFNKYHTEAYVSSEPLTVSDRPQTLVFELAKGLLTKLAGEPTTEAKKVLIAIPSRLTAFKISTVQMEVIRNQKYEPEQVIIVTTTLPAQSEEVAKNLKINLLPSSKLANEVIKK